MASRVDPEPTKGSTRLFVSSSKFKNGRRDDVANYLNKLATSINDGENLAKSSTMSIR